MGIKFLRISDDDLLYIKEQQDSIPGVKKEIEDYVARNPSVQPELTKALLHIQKAQEFFAVGFDAEITPQALLELKRAREISLTSMLDCEIMTKLGVQSLELGSPIIWTAMILPSFSPPAKMAVVHKDDCIKGALGVATSPITLAMSITNAKFPKSWSDPVVKKLSRVNLVEFDNILSLDGIDYVVSVNTNLSNTRLRFGNSRTRNWLKLEKALFQVAEQLIGGSEEDTKREILRVWSNYSGRN
jgi:hypothetical protein